MKQMFSIFSLFSFLTISVHAVESYKLEIKEHKFYPNELELPANQKVKLIIENLDATAEEFESHDLHREKIIQGGSKATIYIGPLKPGSYTFFGEFNPQTATGRIIVK